MISRFFIDRPIFAAVLSIVITLAGGIALFVLPLSLYPPVSPPNVSVDCKYPGASAQVVAETVAAPIEQQVNGVEGMLYMSSQCTNDGSYNLTVTFEHGMDLNMAQVLVQNRATLALPLLPDVIKQAGITTRKRSPDILMAVALNSPEGLYDQLYLSNYAAMKVRDEIVRVPGVSDCSMLGQQDYSMRIWVDPDRLAVRGLTAGDVVAALRQQNLQVATGQVGQPPVPGGQPMQMVIDTRGRLVEPEQFGRVIIRSMPDGRTIRIRDVARVELGAKNQDITCRVNGRPSISLAVWQLPDANALETADRVKAKIAELARDFPPGLRYEIRYDTTPFIRESINEVVKTLEESIILVAVVVLLFLQNWRSAIIPLVAVPVAIIGTFAVMAVMGFSLNNLTLFGLVLAIGIVVDDAIVVVEAVEHHMERGLAPREATVVAMSEVSGPVIAIGLVLSAVFVPCAFISGIVGQFFRQFALTIAASTIISTINSLTLSPALAALLLKPQSHGHGGRRPDPLPRLFYLLLGAGLGYEYLGHDPGHALGALGEALGRLGGRVGLEGTGHHLEGLLGDAGAALAGAPPWAGVLAAVLAGAVVGRLMAWPINRLLSATFAGFNASFRWINGVYVHSVAWMLRGLVLVLLGYGGLLYLTYHGLTTTAKGFIPSADMGYLLVNVQLPDSASLERSQEVMNRLERIAHEVPGVKHSQTMTGQSLLLSAFGSNFGSMFIILDEFSQRRSPELYGEAIMGELRKRYAQQVPDAMVTVLGPPPVRGAGRAGGFKLMVEDRGDAGPETLQGQTENLVDTAKAEYGEDRGGPPRLVGLTSVFRANVPQLFVDVNRSECITKQVALRDLFETLQVYLGSLYVNDFNLFGRTFQVIVQAAPSFRNGVEDVRRLAVRNADAQMVPVGALADIREVNGPQVLTRYNMYPAAPINGSAAPGVSSGDAIGIMESLARRELLPSMAIEWTELAYLELQAGNTAMVVFGFAVVMVFLVLAAQYESWALPLAVILVVPLCLLCAVAGVRMAGQDINIFTQIGFVVLVGLACKNAILIVEFARAQRLTGLSRREATLEACRLRLRPIVMTSLAFILGVIPLLVSRGAGAEMRRTLGTTVFSGMLGVTLFGIALTPVFFVVIDWLAGTRLFRSRYVRFLSSVLMGALSLAPVRTTARRLWMKRRSRGRAGAPARRPAELVAANGHGDDGHAGNGHGGNGHAPNGVNGAGSPDEEPGALVERG